MKKFFKNISGISLIEAIFAMTILSFGLVGSLAVFNNSATDAMDAELMVVANHLANQKLALIANDKASNGYNWIANNRYIPENISSNGQSFSRSVNIYEVSSSDLYTPTASSGLKRVDVTVAWGSQSMTYTSIFSDY